MRGLTADDNKIARVACATILMATSVAIVCGMVLSIDWTPILIAGVRNKAAGAEGRAGDNRNNQERRWMETPGAHRNYVGKSRERGPSRQPCWTTDKALPCKALDSSTKVNGYERGIVRGTGSSDRTCETTATWLRSVKGKRILGRTTFYRAEAATLRPPPDAPAALRGLAIGADLLTGGSDFDFSPAASLEAAASCLAPSRPLTSRILRRISS